MKRSGIPQGYVAFFLLLIFLNGTSLVLAQSTNSADNQTIDLSGANHNPPIDSTGMGSVLVSADGDTLTLEGTFEGLVANVVASHIHVGAAGENGPIVIPLMLTANEGDPRSGTLSVTHTLTEEEAQWLRDGRLYVNVHSEAFPSGELRGQIAGMSSQGRPLDLSYADVKYPGVLHLTSSQTDVEVRLTNPSGTIDGTVMVPQGGLDLTLPSGFYIITATTNDRSIDDAVYVINNDQVEFALDSGQ